MKVPYGGKFLAVLCLLAAGPSGAIEYEPADQLFSSHFHLPFHFQSATLNPAGDLVASYLREDDQHLISILDSVERRHIRHELDIGGTNLWLRWYAWIDDETLVVVTGGHDRQLISPRSRRGTGQLGPTVRTTVLQIERDEGNLTVHAYPVNIPGWVVSPLRRESDYLLFAVSADKGAVHRLAISRLIQPDELLEGSPDRGRSIGRASRVASLDKRIWRWLVNPDGDLIGAYVTESGRFEFWHRRNASQAWRKLLTFRPDDDFDPFPVGLSSDGKTLLALSSSGRNTRALFEFDLAERERGALIFAHPTADVEDVVYGSDGSIVRSVVYLENGVRRYHYLTTEGEPSQWLRSRFPDKNVALVSESVDARKVVAHVEASNDPGTYYHLDLDAELLIQFGSAAPWIDPDRLARVETYRIESRIGLEIEGYLAMPHSIENPPMIVLPHGGPIGVASGRHYNAVVQQLAYQGYAVLEVNYRGSGGYGKDFLDSGKGEWGRGIEDDIDAVVDHIIELGLVDATRMCVVGASYGGYSALMSVIRDPKRFRCAATLAGVTDIPLMFSTADWSLTRSGRAHFEEIVGNPRTEYQRMKEVSPVYRVNEIQVPIFLAHGAKDVRVDVEHAYRLKAMLDLHGKDYYWMLLPDDGHGFSDAYSARQYYARLSLFLGENLQIDDPPIDEQ